MKADLTARLLRRDGQCSDLTLERWLAGELSEAERALLDAHLDAHPADRARADALQRDQAALAPPKPSRAPLWSGGALLALAAGLLLAFWWSPSPRPIFDGPDDGIRIKAGALDLEIFVHNGEGSRLAAEDEVVHPGDRVGFRVKARGAGYVLVAGVDEAGAPYPCWPAGEAPDGAPWDHEAPVALDQAMSLDGALGEERFVAVHCQQPITFEALSTAMRAARATHWATPLTLRPDCAARSRRLEKR